MTLPDTGAGGEFGRWALAGLGPAGRFLLERWSLRHDFPLVAVCSMPSEERNPAEQFRLPLAADVRELLVDPRIDGLILTVPPAARAALIRDAFSAGKRILVEGLLCEIAAEAARLEHLAHSEGRSVGVFHVRRAAADFHAARSAIVSRRLGTLHTVRWIDCEYSAPAGTKDAAPRQSWLNVLSQTGPPLFDQLAMLTEVCPQTVQAWPQPETAGFQTRMHSPPNLTVWIDVQRASQAGLQTGWVLEGTTGAYRAGRLMTLAEDGELREEDLPPSAEIDDDVMTDLRRLASTESESRASLRRSVQAVALTEAVQRAAELGIITSPRRPPG